MGAIKRTSKFGITIGIYTISDWDELYKSSIVWNSNFPYILGKFYTFNNELNVAENCGFETIGQFKNIEDATKIYETKNIFQL